MTAVRGRPLGEKGGVFCQASHLSEPSDVGERRGPQPPEKLGSSQVLGDKGGKRNGHDLECSEGSMAREWFALAQRGGLPCERHYGPTLRCALFESATHD